MQQSIITRAWTVRKDPIISGIAPSTCRTLERFLSLHKRGTAIGRLPLPETSSSFDSCRYISSKIDLMASRPSIWDHRQPAYLAGMSMPPPTVTVRVSRIFGTPRILITLKNLRTLVIKSLNEVWALQCCFTHPSVIGRPRFPPLFGLTVHSRARSGAPIRSRQVRLIGGLKMQLDINLVFFTAIVGSQLSGPDLWASLIFFILQLEAESNRQ